MSRSPAARTSLLASVLAIALATGVTACSGGSADSGGSAVPTTSANPSPSQSGYPVEFKATLRTVESRVNNVGKSDSQTYGVTVAEGSTQIDDVYVKVRMLNTVDYTDKSGKLGGYLELIWRDGTILGFRQTGSTTYEKTDKEAQVQADLEVVEGSGKATGTSGTGELTGTGSGSVAVGSTMKIEVSLNLINAPQLITGDEGSRGTPTPSSSYAATIAP